MQLMHFFELPALHNAGKNADPKVGALLATMCAELIVQSWYAAAGTK